MRPFVWLLVVMLVLDVLELGASNLYDLHRTYNLATASNWTEDAVLSLLLAFAMGSGLLAREAEDGTLAFLDGLPLRRRDVFLSKLAVAGACLSGYAMATPAIGWMLHATLRFSVDEPVAASALVWVGMRYALLMLCGLALGLLFGFVRYLAWALFALAAAGVFLLRRSAPRLGSALDPAQLLADGWATRGLGGDTVWAIAALTVLCLLLAYALFAVAGGAGMQRLGSLARRRSVMVVVCVAGLAAVSFAIYQAQDKEAGVPGHAVTRTAGNSTSMRTSVRATVSPARKLVTAHYTFNVPPGRVVDDAELRAADAAFATAAEAMAIDVPDAARIDVDLSGSINHTAGMAAHERIRINLEPGWHDALVHETVHVLAGWVAGAEHTRGLDNMSLFNEGLAHWAEPSYRHSAALRGREQLVVATLFRRHLLSQDALLDNRTLERELDWGLQYPLGAALIEVLVQRYGRHAPHRILATLARPEFPPDLSGYELYRSAFQHAGFDLNLVLNDYALQLQRWSEADAALIDAMPRPRGLLVRASGKVGIAVQLDRPLAKGEYIVAQFRPRADSRLDEVVAVDRLERLGARQVAWLPRAQVAGNQVCYQLRVQKGDYGMAEPWSCLPLRVAAEGL